MKERQSADAVAAPKAGRLFILSAPSGAGKTTLCRAIRQRFPDLRYSISHTTRNPRGGEQEGCDYYFIGVHEFEEGIANNRWAEWAEVHGHYYGTSARTLERWMSEGTDVLLDIDVQGARQLMDRYPACVSIFIMPPSLDILEQRLESRGSDSRETRALRLKNAEQEMRQKDRYQYVITNDRLADAVERLTDIIQRHRLPA